MGVRWLLPNRLQSYHYLWVFADDAREGGGRGGGWQLKPEGAPVLAQHRVVVENSETRPQTTDEIALVIAISHFNFEEIDSDRWRTLTEIY